MLLASWIIPDWVREEFPDMPAGEEFLLGKVPSRDGTGYGPGLPTPTWAQLTSLLFGENINKMAIILVGKVGSDPTKITGVSGIVTAKDVLNAPLKPGQQRASRVAIENPKNTNEFAKKLLGLNVTPSHITGIVIRKLN